jgi:hypothetical protein
MTTRANSWSRTAIFNRFAATEQWEAKGPQVCLGSLGDVRKKARKNGIEIFKIYDQLLF